MTPEQRLIRAVKERAFASVVYTRAFDINQAAHNNREDVYQRARDAADKVYQAFIKAELDPEAKATEEALRWANDDWRVWDKEYTTALKALTDGDAVHQWDDEDWKLWDEKYALTLKTLTGGSND